MKDGSLAREEIAAGGLKEVHVTIITESSSAEPYEVHVKAGEEVVWDSDKPGKRFKVHFREKKPFKDQDFDEAHNRSGEPVEVPPPGEERRYEYWVNPGPRSVDPIVVVRG